MSHRNKPVSKARPSGARPEPSRHIPRAAGLLLALIVLGLAAGSWYLSVNRSLTVPEPVAGADAEAVARYAGSTVCRDCHGEVWDAWQGSQHAKAMQPASETTVLGDFDNASFRYAGVESTFFRRNGGFFVRTDGADGVPAEFQISHTFGVTPLQQYLVPMAGGRLQALSIAWDSRPHEQGGQRWFHLYPDEQVTHDDVLHWTRPAQNWNSMCADCHSTNLQKHYDPATGTFATTWSEINVACEACHGPASRHVAWARQEPGSERYAAGHGLLVSLDERVGISWDWNEAGGRPVRSRPRSSEREIEVCAHCHARRSLIADGYVPGQPLLDHYLPALLRDGLYFDDGQIDDEVYVYGSFLQSRMHQAGVTCSDCHDPHSMQLRAPGNAVCTQCHSEQRYGPAHHHHAQDSAAARCVACHMPERSYMVVDPRRDHSLRIPRPDLTQALGTPNVCNGCHTDRDAAWASAQLVAWYGAVHPGNQDYAQAFHAARQGSPTAGTQLAALVRDATVPGIARATALAELAPNLAADSVDVLPLSLRDPNSLVRAAAVGVLEHAPPALRVRLAFPMLDDPVRAVRIEAARVLAALPAGDLPEQQQALLERATEEYRAAQRVNAERPEAQVNLGNLYAMQGNSDIAIESYTTATAINPWFVPGYVNLADLYRSLGRDAEAVQVLQDGLSRLPEQATLHHALGLTLVRLQQLDAAMAELGVAAGLDPGNATYTYVYAVALHSSGRQQQAIDVLEQALTRFPGNRDMLAALVSFYRDSGDEAAAQRYAERLQALPVR